MAESIIPIGKIQMLVGDQKTKSISSGGSIELASITIPNVGTKWLVLSHVALNFTADGVMNNEINIGSAFIRRTRTTQVNAGGCINYVIADAGSTVSVSVAISNGSGNATGIIQAFPMF